jgi:hypothetical protein
VQIFTDEKAQRFEKEEQREGYEIVVCFYTHDVLNMLSQRLQNIFQNLIIIETNSGELNTSAGRRGSNIGAFMKKSTGK